MTNALGLDISSNNHGTSGEPFDFLKVKADGYSFVYVKATQGNNYLNAYLIGDVKRAFDAGLKVGIYHFMSDPKKIAPELQADWFYTNGIALVNRECGENVLTLSPVLDYEQVETNKIPDGDARDDFMTRLVGHYPHLVGQYLDQSFFDAIGHAGAFTWLAVPGVDPEHYTPADGVEVVQYTQAAVDGIVGMKCDIDYAFDVSKLEMSDAIPPVVKPPTPKPPVGPAETVERLGELLKVTDVTGKVAYVIR